MILQRETFPVQENINQKWGPSICSWLISARQRIAPDLRRAAGCARDLLVRGMENCAQEMTATQLCPVYPILRILQLVNTIA